MYGPKWGIRLFTIFLHLGVDVEPVLFLCLKLEYPTDAFHIVEIELDVVPVPQFSLFSHHDALAQDGIEHSL